MKSRRSVLIGAAQLSAAGILWLRTSGSVYASAVDDFFLAAQRDQGRVIETMLRRGLDPNLLNAARSTGLIVALQNDSKNAAAALLNSRHTDVNLRNANKETALMMASLRGQVPLVQALIARGADINHPGWTPLHYAASGITEQQPEIIAMLLAESAYIDAESPNGTTPLMMAARYGTEAALDLLLREGADTNLKNQLGLTAIDFAMKAERKTVAEKIANSIRRAQPQQGRW